MRTKILLLTAAIGMAVSAATAQVYSVNAVGYVNLDLVDGQNLICNPLDNQDGNLLSNILADAPDNSIVWRWLEDRYQSSTKIQIIGWTPDWEIAPGEAFWVIPVGATTITFVGEVPQGDVGMTVSAPKSFISSVVPQRVELADPEIGYPAVDNELIWQYDEENQTFFDSSTYLAALTGWFQAGAPTQVPIEVGEGFITERSADGNWARTFNVNDEG
jgi:hypothetical protein